MKNTNINIPLGVKISGQFSIDVIDTRTGKVRDHRPFQKNLLLDDYLNSVFTSTSTSLLRPGSDLDSTYPGLLNGSYQDNDRVEIGTDATAPARSQMGAIAHTANATEDTSRQAFSSLSDNPVWGQKVFVLVAGSWTGTVRELAFKNLAPLYISRQLVQPEINLTSTDELVVTWRFSVDLGTRVWTGTIPAGQLDGITDIAWRVTVNDAQVTDFLGAWITWKDYTPGAVLGTSNADSVIATDEQGTLKGTTLWAANPVSSTLFTRDTYVAGSYTHSETMGWEHDSPNNVQIGEMLLLGDGVNYARDALCRITFTPALNKAEFYRLFLTITRSILPG